MQLYVQLVCAGLLKCYHKTSDFGQGKARVSVHSFSLTPQSIHNQTNQPFKLSTALLTALLITLLFLHLSPCYYLYTLHHNNSITVNGSNNTIDKTLYINNITIPQHTQNPPELKIEPCRTMLYFKAQNRLSESRSYSIDIIIKRYN